MDEPTQTGPHSGDLDLMIAWLGGTDEEKVEKATTILFRIGKPIVKYLVQAAMKSDRRPKHRVRLLDIVQQIGQPLGVDEFFGARATPARWFSSRTIESGRNLHGLDPGGPPGESPRPLLFGELSIRPSGLHRATLREEQKRAISRTSAAVPSRRPNGWQSRRMVSNVAMRSSATAAGRASLQAGHRPLLERGP